MIRRKAPARPAKAPPSSPWSIRVGQWASFYHEGGSGEKHWVRGWRHGVIRAVPIKGRHKHWVQLELPAACYMKCEDGKYKVGPKERAWCHSKAVNPLGDTVYHGTTLKEEVIERREQKAEDQAKANVKVAGKVKCLSRLPCNASSPRSAGRPQSVKRPRGSAPLARSKQSKPKGKQPR